MTVCIAAIAGHEGKDAIVMVADTKLTTGYYSQEQGAMKMKRIHHKWAAMVAGKFAQNRPIITAIDEGLSKIAAPTVQEMTAVCTKAYISEAKKLAEESVSARFGLSMEEFLDSRKRIGDSLFERTWSEISRIEVGCDLLVCGFDNVDKAHVFVVSNPTSDNPSFITDYDFPSFAAIGTGHYLAESTLYAYGHTEAATLAETIFHALIAKFTSESATDVGKDTMGIAWDAEGNMVQVPFELVEDLKEGWETEGKPEIPVDDLEAIEEEMKKTKITKEKPEAGK